MSRANIVGENLLTALSSRFHAPGIIDQVYDKSNALLFRLNRNKGRVSGGYQIEQTFVVEEWSNGGWFSDFDVLDTAPNDTVANGKWEMSQLAIPVTFSHRQLIEAAPSGGSNRDEANRLYDVVGTQWELAKTHMTHLLGKAIHSDQGPKALEPLTVIVNDASGAAEYAGLSRTTYPFLEAQVDDTSSTLTMGLLREMVASCTKGGHTTSLILSRREQYSRLHSLMVANQYFSTPAPDLESAGFRHIGWEGIPWVVDDYVADGPDTNNSRIYFLNEDAMDLYTWGGVDYQVMPFKWPADQAACVGHLLWYGQLVSNRPQVQGVLTNVSS